MRNQNLKGWYDILADDIMTSHYYSHTFYSNSFTHITVCQTPSQPLMKIALYELLLLLIYILLLLLLKKELHYHLHATSNALSTNLLLIGLLLLLETFSAWYYQIKEETCATAVFFITTTLISFSTTLSSINKPVLHYILTNVGNTCTIRACIYSCIPKVSSLSQICVDQRISQYRSALKK